MHNTTKVLIIPSPTVRISQVAVLVNKDENAKIITRAKLSKLAGTKLDDIFFSKEELMGHGIKSNKIRCKSCGNVIESIYTFHSVRCSCGKCMIDGGTTELQRNCACEYDELTEYYHMY